MLIVKGYSRINRKMIQRERDVMHIHDCKLDIKAWSKIILLLYSDDTKHMEQRTKTG